MKQGRFAFAFILDLRNKKKVVFDWVLFYMKSLHSRPKEGYG